tara:strand:- start:559 stop:705 length:147 start_codon:yes stop_codon:yes gene_type:complete
MPLPKKNKKESKEQFMKRCIADKNMVKEFSNIKQRIAVCLTKSKEKEK